MEAGVSSRGGLVVVEAIEAVEVDGPLDGPLDGRVRVDC